MEIASNCRRAEMPKVMNRDRDSSTECSKSRAVAARSSLSAETLLQTKHGAFRKFAAALAESDSKSIS